MAIRPVTSVAAMVVAPEIRKAQEAIKSPEVRQILKRLAKHHLGVCIPHMHRPGIDFDALPKDTIQVEEDCRVRWVNRSELDGKKTVPVAWRWVEDSTVSDVECIQTCTPNEKKGHQRGHL